MQSGIKYILIANLFSLFIEISIKSLSQVPFYFIAFYRSIIITFICVGYLCIKKVSLLGNSKKRLFMRGITGTVALIFYFITLQKLPLAFAVSLQYLSPMFAVLFVSILAKKLPRKIDLLSLFLSLLGIVVMGEFEGTSYSWLYGIMGLLSAIFSGLAYTNINRLNKTDNTVVIMLYFSAITLISLTPYCAFHWKKDFSPQNYFLLIFIGVASYITQYFVTKAYQATSTILIASTYYLNLVFASLIGHVFWREALTRQIIAGIILIIIANILINIKKEETPFSI